MRGCPGPTSARTGRDVLTNSAWPKRLLDALCGEGVSLLPYLPDGALTPVIKLAEAAPDVTPVPLTREEEGVGISVGANLAGRRSALLMQVSGLGNSLNAIGSLAMAQRIPLLMIISERGGLGETVSTQVPFGAAAGRVLDAVGVSRFPLEREQDVDRVVSGAVELAFVSRVTVAVMLTPALLAEVSE